MQERENYEKAANQKEENLNPVNKMRSVGHYNKINKNSNKATCSSNIT